MGFVTASDFFPLRGAVRALAHQNARALLGHRAVSPNAGVVTALTAACESATNADEVLDLLAETVGAGLNFNKGLCGAQPRARARPLAPGRTSRREKARRPQSQPETKEH